LYVYNQLKMTLQFEEEALNYIALLAISRTRAIEIWEIGHFGQP